MTFGHVWPLLLLLGIPFLWKIQKTTRVQLERSRLRRSACVRSLVIFFLALALMEPVWHRAGSWLSVVFVLDVSRSVAPEFLDSALDWIQAAVDEADPDEARFIAFAASPLAVADVGELRRVPVSTRGRLEGASLPAGTIDQGRTNIEDALDKALRASSARRVRRVVLVSDGLETEGDVTRAVHRAREQGVRVFTVAAPSRAGSECWIDDIDVPEAVRAGEPIDVGVRVFCTRATGADIELRQLESGAVEGKEVDLVEGSNRVMLRLRMPDEGLVTLEAGLDTGSRYRRALWVAPRSKVLLVEGDLEGARYLRQALDNEGLDVVTKAAGDLPSSLGDYDAVILSDVPSETLDEGKMQALSRYVRELEGGLTFIAGETSFGESGYHGTILEEVLPIRFRVQEKHKEVALVIVLDKSYSMTGEKIALAKEATKAALDLLEEEHHFGVVAFDWYPRVVVPLQLAEDKDRLKETIDRVAASDPTRIYPALEEAYKALAANPAKVKHVILLSDGKSQPAEFEELVRRMADDEISISTVSVGEEADEELLLHIAEWGNGRSYVLQDARRVPEVFIREAQIATESTLAEKPFRPVVKRRVEALSGIDWDSVPELRGYVNMEPKESAEVLLESPTEAPVLARWRYGLGRSAVFTSDAKNRWASAWLGWEGYGKFWAQMVRETMRARTHEGLDFRVERRGGVARVSLEAVDDQGRFRNDMEPGVAVVDPEGRAFAQTLRQTRPGGYEAEIPIQVSTKAPYVFSLAGPGPLVEAEERPLFFPRVDEDRFYPTDTELLRIVAEETGAVINPEVEDIFADYGDRAYRLTPLAPLLAGLALIAYLLDIALRRLPWPKGSSPSV